MAASFRTAACAAAAWALASMPGAQPAHAEEDAEMVWRCWYESAGVYRIRCLPRAPAGPLSGLEDWERATDIPIYAPPIGGTERSERLARAALCGRNAACRVAFDPAAKPVSNARGN